jgi:hypothetical protein
LEKNQGRRFFRTDNKDYVTLPEYNLIPTVSFADIEGDYATAAGRELAGKFCAAYSSAALVANSFGLFRNERHHLMPETAGFNALSLAGFEQTLPIAGLRGHAPTLDAVLTGGKSIVAIESKLTEPLTIKRGEFSASYDKLVPTMEDGWRKAFQIIREQPDHFGGFDAAQIVKHYLGIRCAKAERRLLLYLFLGAAQC